MQDKINAKNIQCLLRLCFVKLLMRIVFKNIENIILILFENCSYSLNLVFYVFFITKKKKTGNQKCFPYSPCFLKQKTIFKQYLKACLFIVFEKKNCYV